MAGQSGKAKLWELANYGSIPESLVFTLHYTRLTVAVNSFVPFCSFRVRISNSGFQTRGPTPLHWHARRAPMECLLGPCGATPLERHCAELTVHGVEVNTPAIPRLDPVLTPRHFPRNGFLKTPPLPLRTPAPLTTSSSPRPEPASPGPGAGRRRRFGVRDRPVAWHGGVVLQIRAGRPDPTRAARVGGDRWQPQQAHLKRSVGASAMGHPRRRERVQQRRVLPPPRAQRGLRLRLHRRGRRGRWMRTAK